MSAVKTWRRRLLPGWLRKPGGATAPADEDEGAGEEGRHTAAVGAAVADGDGAAAAVPAPISFPASALAPLALAPSPSVPLACMVPCVAVPAADLWVGPNAPTEACPHGATSLAAAAARATAGQVHKGDAPMRDLQGIVGGLHHAHLGDALASDRVDQRRFAATGGTDQPATHLSVLKFFDLFATTRGEIADQGLLVCQG